MDKEIALEMRGVSKYFGSVAANKNVDLKVYKGEILAVLGENGSGKTTLMNMISGIYFPDEGQTFVDGEEAVIRSPQDAFAYKIGMIHQHFKLVDVFTAAQNIVLGVKNQPKPIDESKNAFLKFFAKIGRKIESGLYKKKEVAAQVKEIADKYGFEIEPKKKIYDMSVSEKQTVEIVKVLYRGANVLILDEPTAVLTPQETEKLFAVLRKMKEDGKSIIIITHKLNEVLAISDRVAVLRKGESVGEIATKDADENKLTEMMVGKKVELNIERSLPQNPAERLVIKGLNLKNHDGVKVLDNISFTAKSGEILGIAGIAGSGQKELLEAIAGLQKLESGDMIFHNPKKDFTGKSDKEIKELVNAGKVLFKEDEIIDLKDKTPLQIRELGIRLSFVPEDRLGMGLVGNMDIVDNMMLRSYRKGKSVFLDRGKPGKLADEIIKELEVVTPSAHTPVRKLSVGEDLDVLIELCDRILVIGSGKVTGIVDGRSANKSEIGLLMTKTESMEENGGESVKEAVNE